MGIAKNLLTRTPPLNIGPRLLNLLGLQVLRTLFANAFRIRRAPRMRLGNAYQDLQRDGIAIVPDFLSPSEFEEFRTACQQIAEASADKRVPVRTLDGKVIHDISLLVRSEKIHQRLATDPRIHDLVASVTGRKVNKAPTVTLWMTQLVPDASTQGLGFTSTNYLHPDVHYPSVKVWLALKDMDRNNGAYEYVRGGHKLNLKRLALEYKQSLKGKTYGGLTDQEAKDLGLSSVPVEAKANTLIISNQMGYHKRGYSQDERQRLLLHVDFRYVESLENKLLGLLPKNFTNRLRKSFSPRPGV